MYNTFLSEIFYFNFIYSKLKLTSRLLNQILVQIFVFSLTKSILN